jgi:serine-type D-Ala-D-Ala carboxypeptidase/endopeptidase (penicillin-binding protein 4)
VTAAVLAVSCSPDVTTSPPAALEETELEGGAPSPRTPPPPAPSGSDPSPAEGPEGAAEGPLEPPPPPASRPQVVATARSLVDAALQTAEGGRISVLVVDEHGREVVSHEPDTSMLPASTLKVVTAAAILTTLGPRARLTTVVEATAPIDGDGVLRGELVLLGAGDPVLATEEYGRWVYPARPRTPLEDLADQLVAAGLRRAEGDVVGSVGRFSGPNLPEGWIDRYFSDLDARYSEGLTVDAGLRTIVTYPEPPVPDDDEPDAPEGVPDGEQADLGPPRVLVDHAREPALHAVREFVRLLEERDVEVVGEARVGAPEGTVVGRLASVDSPPLLELLRFAIRRSDNQLTDGLFRLAGRVRTGDGSWERGDRALRQVLDRYGVAHDGAVFADGSGLSREDRVTARLLVDLDRAMLSSRHAEAWISIMAVMGENGTLERRLAGTPAQGYFYGKTGTLRDVSGLSGSVLTDAGPHYHLAVLANDGGSSPWIARALADQLVLLLSGDARGCAVRDGAGESALGRAPVLVSC